MKKREKTGKLGELFARGAKALVSAVYPEDITCDCCGAELTADTRYRLCAACTEKMPFVKGHICASCGVPLAGESDWCPRCQDRDFAFEKARSPLVYEGLARTPVYALKFGGKRYIAKLLGAMMSDCYLSSDMRCDIIVPVPMSESELKKRGFNQAELLAREVGGRLGMPVLPALIKLRDTRPQKELTGKERAKNLEGSFTAAFAEYISGRRLLLADDVLTTGATADECARTLLKAGAKSVCVLTAAATRQRLPSESAEDTAETEG